MQNKKLALKQLVEKCTSLANYFSTLEDSEKKLLHSIIKEKGYKEFLDANLSLAECHVIDCIGGSERVNTTAIARKMNMTKGGISKITAKLLKKQMIEVCRLNNNQKETYFMLTQLGEKAFQMHAALHEQVGKRIADYFSSYSYEQVLDANQFLDDLMMAFQFQKEKKS